MVMVFLRVSLFSISNWNHLQFVDRHLIYMVDTNIFRTNRMVEMYSSQ